MFMDFRFKIGDLKEAAGRGLPALACWVQSSSGIITVMAGCGSSMSSGPQVAINLMSRERWLSLRTYKRNGDALATWAAADDSETEHPDNVPKASGFILAGHAFRHGDVRIKNRAGEKHGKFDSGFLRGLGDFNLHAVGDGLCAGVGVEDWSERGLDSEFMVCGVLVACNSKNQAGGLQGRMNYKCEGGENVRLKS